MPLNISSLNFFRTLSFGGLLGSGIAGLLFLSYPHLFVNVIGIKSFVLFGGLVGAAFHQVIESTLKYLLGPVGNFIDYHEKRIELAYLRKGGKISDKQYREILFKLTERRFLGKESSGKKLLPPDE